MEQRRLLSLSTLITGEAPNRALEIDGDDGNQDVCLALDAGQTNLVVSDHGAEEAIFALAEFDRVEVRGLGGDDTLTLEFSDGKLVPGGITYDGGVGGFDTLVLGGTAESTVYTSASANDGQIVVDGSLYGETSGAPGGNLNYRIPTTTLSPGNHRVTVHAKDDEDTWSAPVVSHFDIEQVALSISDVTLPEGDSGLTSFDFVVTARNLGNQAATVSADYVTKIENGSFQY